MSWIFDASDLVLKQHQQLRKLHALNKKQRVIIFSHKNKVSFRYLCSVVYATNINAMTFSVLFPKVPPKITSKVLTA